jgi:hypothetical protein
MKRRSIALVLALCVGGLSRSIGPAVADPLITSTTEGALGGGLDATAVDPTVGACQNFYRHACGGFIARTPVNAQTPSVVLADRRFDANLQQTMGRVFQPAGDANRDVRRLAAFQTACLATNAAASGTVADQAIIHQWLQ